MGGQKNSEEDADHTPLRDTVGGVGQMPHHLIAATLRVRVVEELEGDFETEL